MNDRAKAARGVRSAAAVTTLLQSVCDRLPVGFALFDADLELAAWNARFAALQGYPRKLVKAGTPLESFVRFDVERGGHGAGAIDPLTRRRLAALKRGQRTEREQALPDGRILYIASELVPGAGVLLTCEDVTENRSNEERLRESAARYELALRGISEGFYDWDIANDTIHYSERVRNVLGLSPAELKTPLNWRARIHPDDLARYDAAHVAHFKGETERFECEYRYRGRDGTWRWARQHGVALRDARGRAYRMVGSTGDITELKRVEEALRESEERHAFAMRAAVEGIYEWNVETDTLFLSDHAKAFFAFPAEKLAPKDWNARIHPEDLEAYRRATVSHFKGRTPHLELEYRIRDAAGGYRWVLDRGIAVRSAEGRVTRLIGALSDITQRKLAEIELRRARDEATAALAEQTALREVLEAISRSAFDLDAVLRTLIEHATRLVRAEKGFIFRLEGDVYRLAVDFGTSAEFREFIARNVIRTDSAGLVGLTAREGRTVHIEDALTDPRFGWHESQRLGGFRTMLGVPMHRDGAVIGVIALWKERVEPFTQAQMDLVTAFSNQALIAIENARLFKETKEALEQQTATAEILRLISTSPTDLQPVLDAVASTAARLCGASDALIRRVDGGVLQRAAHHGSIPASNEARLINRDSISGRAVVERRTIHVRDVAALEEGEFPVDQALARRFGYRTVLCAPLLREGQPIGTIAMRRVAALPFSDQQIKLFQTFADQAVIAIENVRLFKELEARNRELTEALEQQTATGEILRVISGSPTDIQPVLDAVASTAARLCDASDVLILRRDGEMLRQAAQHGSLPAMAGEEVPVDRGWVTGRCVVDRRSVQVDDVAALDEAEFPIARAHQRRWGHRTALSTPLLREGRAIGAIALRRMEVRPFSERQIRLLETFADQAVIAIENVRLFNETKEALERQTATAEILRAISGSLTDVAPVFDAILESAIRLCDGDVAALWRYDGQVLRFAGAKKVSPEAEALFGQNPLELGTYNPTPQAAFERRTVHVMDVFSSAAYRPLIPAGTFNNRPAAPTVLAVPLLREGNLLGVISIWRLQKRLFSYKQVEMVNTFAAQAVIAIENVRLFNETKEALERQTATADILRVMSSSPTDVQPVFEAIVQSGVRLFENAAVAVVRPDGDQVRLMAIAERDPRRADMWRGRFPFPLSRDYMHGAAILDCTTVDVPDVLALTDRFQAGKQNFLASGYRAMTVAPMVRDGAAIGTISVIRMSPGPLSDKQLALLKTFADQAVIAIENVRLFNETKEALEQQKASAEVLQVISSSVSDAQPVFEKILESCERLFVGQHVGINLVGEDGAVRLGPYRGACRADLERIYPLPLSRASASGLAIMERRVMHYPDVEGGADVPEPVRQGGRIMGFKSAIFAPMLWEGRGIGTIWVNREFAGPFSDKEIALLKTFADQAVIAIQNARLFHEIQEKSHQLEIADQHKSAFLANMSHELRTPLNAVIGFSEMLAARYFGELTTKQAEYVNDIHGSGKHLLSLINDILDLSKIEAGRMELELADFDLRGALDNALTLVRERAQRGGVALRLETDPRLGRYRGDERKLKQVVLNLLSNAVKFTPRGGAVSVVAKLVDGSAEIVVTDTGVGIAPADQEAIFEAFRQVGTDATRKREGTGLGLALTRRFVELHGGTIRVASAPGKGSTFTVTLPIRHGE